MAGEKNMYIKHSMETLDKNSPLDCQSPIHDPLIIEQLRIPVNLELAIYTPSVGLISNHCMDVKLGSWSRIHTVGLIQQGRAGRCSRNSGTMQSWFSLRRRSLSGEGRPLITRGRPKQYAGQCALLIRYGGSDFARRHLRLHAPSCRSSICRCLGSWGNVVCITLIFKWANHLSVWRCHRLWASFWVD